ncbi:hypothetical protein F4801DRAFT_333391 [Xylaria longipes]|nr:hypothetical protein F4801DRAFT_333391 [Xylaria longipes]
MRFTIFSVSALVAPQLASGLPPLPHELSHHQQFQVAEKAVSQYTPAHPTDNLNPLIKRDKNDMRTSKVRLHCPKHGAQCAQFPPGAPSNESLWVRMYCHGKKKKQHHYHHHPHHQKPHKPQNPHKDGSCTHNTDRPLFMSLCPVGTRCRVNALPPGYSNPPWLDGPDPCPDPDPISRVDPESQPNPGVPPAHGNTLGLDSSDPYPDPDTDPDEAGLDDGEGEGEDEEGLSWINLDTLTQQAGNDIVTVLDTFPADGQVDVQKYVQPLPWWDIAFTCVHPDDDDQYKSD